MAARRASSIMPDHFCWIRLRAAVSCLLLLLGAAPDARAQCEATLLTGPGASPSDQFGDAVALSDQWLVVGASRRDDLGSAAGAAYVYRAAPDGTWEFETTLFAPDGATNDLFGWSVTLDGDVIAVGAYLDDHVASNAGSVYVFRWDGALWQFEQRLAASDALTGDEFGQAVAAGTDLIAVGAARRDEAGLTNTGAVYVYRWDGVSWNEEVKLVPPAPAEHDRFGEAVAASGERVLVGAPLVDHVGLNSGVVRAYDGTVGWETSELIAPADAAPGDKFGQAVAIDGDLAVIGAPLADQVQLNAGVAYVYAWQGAGWAHEVTLGPDFDGQVEDQFGLSVAVQLDAVPADPAIGDLIAIGAPLADGAGVDAGAVYLFNNAGGDWFEQIRLAPSTTDAGDDFGRSVSVSGRFLAAGAPKHDEIGVGSNAGTVALFTTLFGPCSDCNQNDVLDHLELLDMPELDCNGNGMLDVCEIDETSSAAGGPFYCIEECDPDCNDNGVPDACDIDAGTSADIDGNGVPDECEDCDGNGLPDDGELEADPSLDCNENGVLDECDVADGTSADCNANGLPDECEIDAASTAPGGPFFCLEGCASDCNENGIPDGCDIESGLEEDCNEDGEPDACSIAADPDLDLNDNGVLDACEDCDGNGLPDFIELVLHPELDCDDNDVLDVCDIPADGDAPGGPFYCTEDCDPDCNVNGVPDACDVADGTSLDRNGNGIPDECEDCNENGIVDSADISAGTSVDCNENGLPDECEIPVGGAPGGPYFCQEECDDDCNGNGVPDACDVADGTSEDCDDSGIPDECEDCDGNGLGDTCEIAGNPDLDLNDNGILDVCDPDCDDSGLADFLEIALGLLEDCNDNDVPDACEIPVGSSAPGGPFYCTGGCNDCNDNGVPDDCDIAAGTSLDVDPPDGFPDECILCPADIDASGDVGFTDLLTVLSTWGPCPLSVSCPGDVDGDGAIGFTDLLSVLSTWGPCE
ncbi:MAG: hypothetical protein HKN62_05670 [Phycisphaerales bacterium]|nr:hypothetical protein [Phycisphaerales bacterium]